MIYEGRDPISHPLANSPIDVLEQSRRIHRTNRDGVRLQAILNAYPCSDYLLKQQFKAIAQRYLSSCSRGLSLERLPFGLPNWLRQQPQVQPMLTDYPFLLTLLRWECAWHKAYYSARWQPVSIRRCQQWLTNPSQVPPWQLNPGFSVLRSTYNIDAIWQALNQLKAGKQVEVEVERTEATIWLCYPSDVSQHWLESSRAELAQLRRLHRGLEQHELQLEAEPELIANAISMHWLVARESQIGI